MAQQQLQRNDDYECPECGAVVSGNRCTCGAWQSPQTAGRRLNERTYPDQKLGLPPRPCSACGTPFKPTWRRRVLCYACFYNATD